MIDRFTSFIAFESYLGLIERLQNVNELLIGTVL